MKSIRRRYICFSVLSIVGILLTALFISMQTTVAAIACGVASATALLLLYRQGRQLSAARLICENRILTVTKSIVTAENRFSKKKMEESVVSTFGMILGNKVYKWGCDGMHGTCLHKIWIDREHIWLTFGTDDERVRVELLHGMACKEKVLMVAQKLRYETGVQAEVCDW